MQRSYTDDDKQTNKKTHQMIESHCICWGTQMHLDTAQHYKLSLRLAT